MSSLLGLLVGLEDLFFSWFLGWLTFCFVVWSADYMSEVSDQISQVSCEPWLCSWRQRFVWIPSASMVPATVLAVGSHND